MMKQSEILKKYKIGVNVLFRLKFGYTNTNKKLGKIYRHEPLLEENKDFVYKRGNPYFTDSGIKKIEDYLVKKANGKNHSLENTLKMQVEKARNRYHTKLIQLKKFREEKRIKERKNKESIKLEKSGTNSKNTKTKI